MDYSLHEKRSDENFLWDDFFYYFNYIFLGVCVLCNKDVFRSFRQREDWGF